MHPPNKPMLGKSHVARVFARLQAQQGAKFAEVLAGSSLDDVMDEWAAGLYGFRGRELERGCDKAASFQWAITLPAFKLLARPALDPEAAWYEAGKCLKQRDDGMAGDWTHPGVWRAAARMSTAIRSGEEFRRHKGRWTSLLDDELSKGWGEEVPLPPQAIGHVTIDKPAPMPDDVRAKLAEMRADIAKGIERRTFEATLKAGQDEPDTGLAPL